jgi:hypothetical protein
MPGRVTRHFYRTVSVVTVTNGKISSVTTTIDSDDVNISHVDSKNLSDVSNELFEQDVLLAHKYWSKPSTVRFGR